MISLKQLLVFASVTLSGAWEYDYDWIMDPPVTLSIPGYNTSSSKRTLRANVPLLPMLPTDNDRACFDISDGFKNLNRGVHKQFFASRPSEKVPISAEVFYLTCNKLEDEGLKQIPMEVSLHNNEHQANIFELTQTYTKVDDIMEIKSFLGSVWKYIAARLPLMSRNEKEKSTSISVVSTTVEVAQVVLHEGLTPSSNFAEAFGNLPDEYEGNEVSYYQFSKTFGTHYATSAKLGGFMSIFHKHSRSDGPRPGRFHQESGGLKGTLYNAMHHPEESVSLTDIFTLGGKLGNRRDFDHWENSTAKYPALIDGEFRPLPVLLETPTKKTSEFNKLIKTEELHYTMKEKLVLIDKLKLSSNKFRFLREILDQEIKFVTPHEIIAKLYDDGLLELHQEWILSCHHGEHWNEAGNWWKGSTVLHLIPGVCVTMKKNVKTCDRGVEVNFPNHISCVVFYADTNCSGGGKSSSHPEEMQRHIPQMRSYTTCRTYFHNPLL